MPKSIGASSRSVAKDLEKKIRASHVTMGNDGTFAMVEKQPERDAVHQRLGIPQQGKTGGFTREPRAENNNQKSNFSTAHQKEVENRFVSLNKQAMMDCKKNDGSGASAEDRAAMAAFKADIRGQHFSFGTDAVAYDTEQKTQMAPHHIAAKREFNLKEKTSEMRAANFKMDIAIKEGQGRTGDSCYAAMISQVADAPGFMDGRAKAFADGKESSVVLGDKAMPSVMTSSATDAF